MQVGALPIRFVDGKPEVLLVTSRESKRWVIPKGWPMKGKKNWAAAAQEAKEEAGVVGRTQKKPVGEFVYPKRR
jgi:8-oxo-dGTP pyrophosphatase MutT (NUDIX family)